MLKTQPQTTNEKTAVSTKRQVASVVASTTVTIALGIAAQVAIAKVAGMVSEKIAPKPQNEVE